MVGQQYLMEIKEFLSMLYFFELMLWVIIYGIYSIINKNHKINFLIHFHIGRVFSHILSWITD